MSKTLWVFKLTNTIKDEHEVAFAELELQSLHGAVERVRNFFDVISGTPLRTFCDDEVRLQDLLAFEPAYGDFQGFVSWTNNPTRASHLVRRLTYTKEFYVATKGTDGNELMRQVFPEGKVGRNASTYAKDGYVLLRVIPNQYFLEKSFYLSKLSRDEKEINKNVEALFSYPFRAIHRIPASATMAVGKRLEDYFTIREEISLYLTHMWHPYKAKFHAKMVRALTNYVAPKDSAVVMDSWTGSGTLNVEATMMGLKNLGLEINPLSALMADVKCQALREDPLNIKSSCLEFLNALEVHLSELRMGSGTTTLLQYGKGTVQASDIDKEVKEIDDEIVQIRRRLKNLFLDEQLREFVAARHVIEESYHGFMRNFFLLALSGSISDLARRRRGHLLEVLALRLLKLMYLRLYLFSRINETLGITVGESVTRVCDNRDPFDTSRTLEGKKAKLLPESVDAIVTSPPYSTAVDYIKNDLPQLTILKLVASEGELEELERNLEGNPKPRLYRDPSLVREVSEGSEFYDSLPKEARRSIEKLISVGRESEAVRTYKFFKDMYSSLISMNRLLKIGGKAAIVIGNNHYKVGEGENDIEEVLNDQVIFELAQRDEIGFRPFGAQDGFIGRPLEKTQEGYIRSETVIVLEKVRKAGKSAF